MTSRRERLIIFMLQGERYALGVEQVAEVLEEVETFPIPKGPPFLAEAINSHGEIVPVLDVSLFLGHGPSSRRGKVLVLTRKIASLALRVDEMVNLVSDVAVAGEESAAEDVVERYLLLAGGRVRVLSPSALVEKVEQSLLD